MSDDWAPRASEAWEQRWISGYTELDSMRPGEYRHRTLQQRTFATWIIAALLVVIAAGVWTSAIVSVLNRNDAKDAGKALAGATDVADASSFDSFDECLGASGTTYDECEAEFGS